MAVTKYILYADDDKDDLDVFAEALTAFPDYTLVTFRTGVDLLAFINQKSPSLNIELIISDINMPFINGLETLRLLKSNLHSKDIPTFLYSTSANAIDTMVAASMNTPILVKPTSLKAIEEIIATMLMTHREASPLS